MVNELILGSVVGVILALTGAGGGILAVPLLMFGIQLNVAEAAPIGLLAVGMAAALGAMLGLKAGIVRYKAALVMSAFGMMAAPVGVWLGSRIDNRWLSVFFAAVLLFVAYRTFKQAGDEARESPNLGKDEPPCLVSSKTGRIAWTKSCGRKLAGSGILAGLLSGLIGVGGGFVMVPALKRYTDLDMQSVIATSLGVIALVSISGVTSSALAGSLNWRIALPFSGGALIGMLLGRVTSAYLAGPQLQKGFAIVSGTVSVGMLVKVFLA